MPVTTIRSEDQYKDAINSTDGIAAIQFVAPWDEPSKAISPKWNGYADNERYKDSMKFYRVDICDQQDVAMTSHVTMAPTFHFYKNGAKIEEYVGSSYPALERKLSHVAKQ
ncbi:hypothetical protein JCM10212_000227 [Sporobolomyces blumeae]